MPWEGHSSGPSSRDQLCTLSSPRYSCHPAYSHRGRALPSAHPPPHPMPRHNPSSLRTPGLEDFEGSQTWSQTTLD